jgi:hypothetical protein
MRTRFKNRFVVVVLAALLAAASCGAQENSGAGAMFAASDGQGHISLLWFPAASTWPAGGWKLVDSAGQVLVPRISSGDPTALRALSSEDADAIGKLPAALARQDTSLRRKQLINIVGLRAFSEPAYARALGLSWTLSNVPPGNHIYKVVGLDAAGKPGRLELSSPAVDASRATAPPPSPDQLQAKVSASGVGLSWAAPAENRELPVIAYGVEREGSPVTAKPVVVGARWPAGATLVLDRAAPPNEMLTYKVFSVDVFGRRSGPGSIRIFFPDFHALVPPDPVQSVAGPGKIVVSWKAQEKANLAGYVVERSLLESGPYEALTPQALPANAGRYEDATVRGGTVYYYRVRAVSPRGDLGSPSHSTMAQPSNPGKPPKAAGLVADAGQTRVRLTWQPVAFSIAGYFVERRAVSAGAPPAAWVRLNPHVTPEPLYDDYVGLASNTKFEYRIVAVAFDNAEGQPSDPVSVSLANLSLPDSPSITAATGAEGRVQLSFSPALPAENTVQFLVLRSGHVEDIGVVIGDPLPGSARQFVDLYVSPGENYWYRLVALDKDGNRSDPTDAVVVRVASPTIAKPPAPTVQFSATPNQRVTVQFAKGPAGLAVIVERKAGSSDAWIRVAGPVEDQVSVTDNAPPAARPLAYRVSYVSADGKVGPASDPAVVADH